jgi:hypothetical protein
MGVPDGGSESANVGESSTSTQTIVDGVGASGTSANLDRRVNAEKRKSTASSSVVGSTARYDELPSSPDSTISRQPLLRRETAMSEYSQDVSTNEREGNNA